MSASSHDDKNSALVEAAWNAVTALERDTYTPLMRSVAATKLREAIGSIPSHARQLGGVDWSNPELTAARDGAGYVNSAVGAINATTGRGVATGAAACAPSTTPRITATHPPTTDARRIDNLRRIEADDSVNAFARSICGEAAARLAELATASATAPNDDTTLIEVMDLFGLRFNKGFPSDPEQPYYIRVEVNDHGSATCHGKTARQAAERALRWLRENGEFIRRADGGKQT